MIIYLITHPDTVVNSKINPAKWKISEYGKKQIRKLAKKKFWKEVQFIFASTEPKAYLAARYWATKHAIPLKIVKGIDEIHRHYLPEDELWENVDLFYEKPNEKARGWETANHCLKRMVDSMEKIISLSKKKHYKTIAVVSHGAVTNLYVCKLKKMNPNRNTAQKKIGSWTIIDVERKKVLTSWNSY